MRFAAVFAHTNTAAKRLRMLQVEHFRSLFQSHFPVKVSRALSASFCVQLVVQLFCFMLLVFLTILLVIEIAFMDNQAQITETISRLDSEKVR